MSFQYKRLLGYRKGEDGKPEIVPEEAAIVERIYEMFLAGQPVKMIAQTLQAEKIEIPGKNLSFSKNMIMNILRNEKYCGDCILQKPLRSTASPKREKRIRAKHPCTLSRTIIQRLSAVRCSTAHKKNCHAEIHCGFNRIKPQLRQMADTQSML